jgi:dUTP pyrophosphatase
MNVYVRFKLLTPTAKLPLQATDWAAGMDISSDEEVLIKPGDWKAVSTGFAMAMEPGSEAQIRPRSGLAAKFGVTVLNAPGTIDADYRGEVKVLLINHGPLEFVVHRGDRIAQMVIAKVCSVETIGVDILDPTDRGSGGFGSTGIK